MLRKIKSRRIKKVKRYHPQGLEDIPLVRGFSKGFRWLVDLAEKVEKAGGRIEREGEIRGYLNGEGARINWRFRAVTLDNFKSKKKFK